MKTVGSHLATMFTEHDEYRHRAMPFVMYLLILTCVVLLYGWLFHAIMAWEGQNHSWFTGVYWALTVMSTLGFGDITFHSDLGRVFSTMVLLTGVLMLLIILPFLFIRVVYAPWLEQRSRSRLQQLQSVPTAVRDHVLICANDPIALGLIRRLKLAGVPAYVIEPDPDTAMRLEDEDVPVVYGDIDTLDTYRRAGADRARMVLANASDTVNSNIVLTVRELSSSVTIAAVASVHDSIDILELSGATHVLPLKQRLGEHLANRVSAGTTRATVIGRFHDLQLAEFSVHNTPLEGRTIRDSGLRESIGVTIVGVWEAGTLVPARPDAQMTALSVPVVIGSPQQIEELNEFLVIYDANPHPVLIIGGGRVGRAAARSLSRREIPVHVVERDLALETKVASVAENYSIGDAADRRVLDEAGIAETPSVLLTTHDDAMNIYLTIYCRRLNPEARTITRATHERNVQAIRRAGADSVLSYASFGIQTVLSLVQGRDLIMLGEGFDLFHVPLPGSLSGKTLSEARIGERTGLNVIAVRENGRIATDLSADRRLADGCTLMTLGSPEQRERFATTYR